QQSLGVRSRELSPAEAGELVPQPVVDDLVAATYCPRDGYATPEAVVQGYAAASGVRIRQSCALTGIDVRGGRIAAVQTAQARRASRGARAARRTTAARARRAADPQLLVGVVRRESGLERDRRRGRRAHALPLRDRLLGPRFSAGARGGRASRRARRRPRADARPLGVRAGPFRRRRRASRDVRRLTARAVARPGLHAAAISARPLRRVARARRERAEPAAACAPQHGVRLVDVVRLAPAVTKEDAEDSARV